MKIVKQFIWVISLLPFFPLSISSLFLPFQCIFREPEVVPKFKYSFIPWGGFRVSVDLSSPHSCKNNEQLSPWFQIHCSLGPGCTGWVRVFGRKPQGFRCRDACTGSFSLRVFVGQVWADRELAAGWGTGRLWSQSSGTGASVYPHTGSSRTQTTLRAVPRRGEMAESLGLSIQGDSWDAGHSQ